MSIKLYELSNTINQVWDLVESEEVDLEVLESTLLSLEEAFETKAEGIASMVKSLEAEAEAIKAEEQRLNARRKAAEEKKEWLKAYLEREMLRSGIRQVKTPKFSVSIRINPPSVDVINVDKIPDDYFLNQDPKVNKKAILEAWKEGTLIDGVRIVRKEGLSIR